MTVQENTSRPANARPGAHETKGERRRHRILDILTSEPESPVSVAELSEAFEVSVATIRRDPSELQDRRLVTRTYGGAALQARPQTELTMDERGSRQASAKVAIGRAGAELVEDGQLLILDSGSTTEQLAAALGNRQVSVVTNGLRVINKLAAQERTQVIVLGGPLRGFNEAIWGATAEAMLGQICASYAFVGTDAVNPVRGLTSRTYEQARLKSAMMAHADFVYVLADSAKLGDHAPSHYWSALPARWGLITDAGADPTHLTELKQAGATSIVVARLSERN